MKLKEAQDRSFELLCLIDDICRREHVPYFLDGGSEIGAVREKDIIPWDDDIDIKLLLADYPAFRDAMRRHLPEGVRLVEPEDFAPRFYDFVVRVVDTRVLRRRVTEEDQAYGLLDNNLCIDVFVHYHIPEGSLSRRLTYARMKLLYGLGLGHRYRLDMSRYTAAQKLPVLLMRAAGRLIPARSLCRHFFRLAGRMDRRYAASPWGLSNWLTGSTYQKMAWYASSVSGELRGRAFPIPVGYDEDLTTYYGDYMHPPKDRGAFIQHLDEEDRYQEP